MDIRREKMATKGNSFTFTKTELAKVKAREAQMTPTQRRAASKALVEANSAANTPRKRKKA